MRPLIPRYRRAAGRVPLLVFVFLPSGCEDPAPPVSCEAIGELTVHVSDTKTVEACFNDANGDRLAYEARSSSPEVVSASNASEFVTVRGLRPGNATVTVVATDPGGLDGRTDFRVLVPNRAPEAEGTVPPVTIHIGEGETVDVSSYFSEPDGQDLAYSAASSDPGVTSVSVAGSGVTVVAQGKGMATVTATAADPGGLTATQSFAVTVPNRAPVAVGEIPGDTLDVGETGTRNLSAYFRDPDGDALAYAATVSDPSVVAIRVSGSTVHLAALAKGEVSVTATATDTEGLAATQVFVVTVPNRKPVAVGSIAARTFEVGQTEVLDVAGHFSDPDGDTLTYSAESDDGAVAAVSVDGPEVTVAALGIGLATVTVTATDPGDLSATQTFEVTVSARGESFDLEMRFTSSVSKAVRSHVAKARGQWEAVLVDTELADISVNRTLGCLGISEYVGTVDDHLIFVNVDEIDGEGGVVAYAGYCYRRGTDDSPMVSATWIDEADVEEMIDEDALVPVMFHEMAHALGFSGGHWDRLDLLAKGDDPHFEGELAIEAFDEAGGDDYDGEKVPVQLKVYSHWRESVFGDEIMTPSINLENDEAPISAITLQAMADAGYEVDVSRADDYELPGSDDIEARRRTGRVLDLIDDVVWGPVTVLGTDGRVIRVIPPPPGSVHGPLPGRPVRIGPGRLPGPGVHSSSDMSERSPEAREWVANGRSRLFGAPSSSRSSPIARFRWSGTSS